MLTRGIPQHRSDTFRHSTCIHIRRPIHAIVEVRLPFRNWMPVSRQKQHSLPVLDDEAMTIYREEGEINQSLSFSSSVFAKIYFFLPDLPRELFSLHTIDIQILQCFVTVRHWVSVPIPIVQILREEQGFFRALSSM